MPGTVGFVAKLLDTLVGAFLNEDQIPELVKRHKLKAKKEAAREALANHDWARLAVLADELRDLATKP